MRHKGVIMDGNRKGRNLALSRMSTYMEGARKSSCVFISHKKEDVDVAITSLKLKGIDELPSFLKINKVLYTCEDFANYVHTLGPYGTIFTEGKKYDAQSIRQEFGRYID